jgi:hypothetical protein
MRYSVVGAEEAHDDLARIWLSVSDRAIVRGAADEIDRQLSQDPENCGIGFPPHRLLAVPPLAVTFRVLPEDRIAMVLQVWYRAPRS